MYFVLPFNKNQCVKLKFSDQNLKTMMGFPGPDSRRRSSLNMGLLVGGEFVSRQLLGLYVQILS